MRSFMAVAVGAGVLAALAASTARADTDWDNPPKGKIAGLEHHTFQSASMRRSVGFNIVLPADYQRNASQRFPVIYYLHGYEGNESSFLDYVKYWRDAAVKLPPCLLVLVNGGESSFFTDAPDGSVMGETVVVKELVPHIDAHYRTLAKPAARSLHGYSMGGFGALKLAFKYPDTFGSVVAYGATLSSAEEMQKHLGKVYKKMFGSRDRFEASNPLALLDRNAGQIGGHVAVALIVGSKDEFLAANRDLAARLKAHKVQTEYIELPKVKHDKEPLYDQAAARAFEFTGKGFRSVGKDERKTKD